MMKTVGTMVGNEQNDLERNFSIGGLDKVKESKLFRNESAFKNLNLLKNMVTKILLKKNIENI